MKKLTVTLRTVEYSTYELEVEDDYMPESGDQIIEDCHEKWTSVSSEVTDETVEDWEIN
jgi:hypothetical protein